MCNTLNTWYRVKVQLIGTYIQISTSSITYILPIQLTNKLFILVSPFSTSSPEGSSSTSVASPSTPPRVVWNTTCVQFITVASFWWFVHRTRLTFCYSATGRRLCVACCCWCRRAEPDGWNFSFRNRWGCGSSIIWCWSFTVIKEYNTITHSVHTVYEWT